MRIYIVAVDEPLYLVPYLREVMVRCRAEVVGAAVLKSRVRRPWRRTAVLALLMLLVVPPRRWFRLVEWTLRDCARVIGLGRTTHHFADVCRELGVPFREIDAVNGPALATHLAEQRVDVLLHQTPVILRAPILRAAAIAVINRHMSLLPAYRGAWPVFWQFVNGESRFGVTIHGVNEGIDTGAIIAQASTPRQAGDTPSLVMERLFAMAADTTVEALARLREGAALLPNDDSAATVYRTPEIRDVLRYLFRSEPGRHAA